MSTSCTLYLERSKRARFAPGTHSNALKSTRPRRLHVPHWNANRVHAPPSAARPFERQRRFMRVAVASPSLNAGKVYDIVTQSPTTRWGAVWPREAGSSVGRRTEFVDTVSCAHVRPVQLCRSIRGKRLLPGSPSREVRARRAGRVSRPFALRRRNVPKPTEARTYARPVAAPALPAVRCSGKAKLSVAPSTQRTTLSGGSLGSHVDEERSQLRYAM